MGKQIVLNKGITAKSHDETPEVIGLTRPPSKRKPEQRFHPYTPMAYVNLVKLTEDLASSAKNHTLHGLGGFAEYDGKVYTFGLEGTYLMYPESAVLPLMRLQRRIMDQIIKEDSDEANHFIY